MQSSNKTHCVIIIITVLFPRFSIYHTNGRSQLFIPVTSIWQNQNRYFNFDKQLVWPFCHPKNVYIATQYYSPLFNYLFQNSWQTPGSILLNISNWTGQKYYDWNELLTQVIGNTADAKWQQIQEHEKKLELYSSQKYNAVHCTYNEDWYANWQILTLTTSICNAETNKIRMQLEIIQSTNSV